MVTVNARRIQADLLVQAGRLLLAYSESTGAIHRALTTTARALAGETCHVFVSYRGVAVTLPGEGAAVAPVRELGYNMAVQARVHEVLEELRRGRLDAPAALGRLNGIEADTPRHPRWLAALLLGIAAASLAGLLGADAGAAGVAGVATALGLFARQELGRRHFSLLTLPLTAAFLGAALGGLAIRLGWTRTPELVLVVPALMVVPGPHLINGLLDLVDNYLPMSLFRLWLATGILCASALGIIVGVELTVPAPLFAGPGAGSGPSDLVTDMALAGLVTCGFAVFYNTPWRPLGMAAVGGMAGHGVRFLALEAGCWLETATFLGGLTVGAVSGGMARSIRAPVAVLAFAGAVTMIPGLTLYRALGGALQLARQAGRTDPDLTAVTFGYTFQGGLVVSALALGLLVGARVVLALAPGQDPPVAAPGGKNGPGVREEFLTSGDGPGELD